MAASILTIAAHMLKNGTLYQDLGADYFTGQKRTKSSTWSADFRISAFLSTPHRRRPPHDLLTGPGFVSQSGNKPTFR
jgi:hypothetical protein